jgi:hypothetical protein
VFCLGFQVEYHQRACFVAVVAIVGGWGDGASGGGVVVVVVG